LRNPKEQSEEIDSFKIHQPDSNALRLNNKAARLIGDAGHSYDSLKGLLYDSAIMRSATTSVSVDKFCLQLNDRITELAGVEPVTGHYVSVKGSSLIPVRYT
jgi:hypothetical protein